jgi:hypothetical protein
MKMIFYILLVFSVILVGGTPGWAGTATLSWNAPTTSMDGTPLTDLAGYKIHYGTTSANYTQVVDVGLPSTPQYTLNLTDGQTYYFVVTAYDISLNESTFSNEVSKVIGTTTGGGGGGSGGGCGMVRDISGRSGPSSSQVALNLAILALLLSLGKMHALLNRRSIAG